MKYLIIFSVAVLSFLAGSNSSNGFVCTILVWPRSHQHFYGLP